jgi:hypothetical protein
LFLHRTILKYHCNDLKESKKSEGYSSPHNPSISCRFIVLVVCIAISILMICMGSWCFFEGSRFLGINIIIVACII